MCGIILVYGNRAFSVSEYPMEDGIESIKHRGNDQVVNDVYSSCSVGFVRMAVTDIDNTQPGRCGDWHVYLNGEIYNYKYLGYAGSECDVIAQGISEFGMGFVERLNGMFFIVAVNGDDVYVARDRYGIKPAYVYQDNDCTIIASEIKAILAYPYYKTRVNEVHAATWMCMQSYGLETLFAGINIFPPAHYQKMGDAPQRYWQWDFTPRYVGYNDAVKKVRLLVEDAIKRQRPDEPFAVSLSGGIDSGIISKLIHPDFEYTVGYSGQDNEYNLSSLNSVSGDHKFIEYDCLTHVDETIIALEDLRAGASWPNYGMYKAASENVRIIIDGAGADELFGGYSWRYEAADYKRQVLNRTGISCAELDDMPDKWSMKDKFTFDAEHFLPGVLSVADKLAMRFTMEVRVPFLDNELVDYAMRLPYEYKVNKRILRDAFADILHADVLSAKKKGFTSPEWIPGNGNQAAKWSIFSFEKWKQHYLK